LLCAQSLLASAPSPPAEADNMSSPRLDDVQPLIAHMFVFAYAWALGGNLVPVLRYEFHAFATELFAPLLALPAGPLLDHYVEAGPGRPPAFRPWADAVLGAQQPASGSQQRVLVPTIDTMRITFIVEACPCHLCSPLPLPLCRSDSEAGAGTAGMPGRAARGAAHGDHRRGEERGGRRSAGGPARAQGRAALRHQLQRADCCRGHAGAPPMHPARMPRQLLFGPTTRAPLLPRPSWRASWRRSGGRDSGLRLDARSSFLSTTSTCPLRCAPCSSGAWRCLVAHCETHPLAHERTACRW